MMKLHVAIISYNSQGGNVLNCTAGFFFVCVIFH